jgi:hypothetical protein
VHVRVVVTAGDGPGADTFVIRISGAEPEGGILRGGNIQVHQQGKVSEMGAIR